MSDDTSPSGCLRPPVARCARLRGFIAKHSLFSSDGSLLFLSSGASVQVHSTRNGERVCDLNGHSSEVRALCRHPCNPLHLVSLDRCGTLKEWDFVRARCVRSRDLRKALPLPSGPQGQGVTFDCLVTRGGRPGNGGADGEGTGLHIDSDEDDANSVSSLSSLIASSIRSFSKSPSLSSPGGSAADRREAHVYCVVGKQHVVRVNLRNWQVQIVLSDVKQRTVHGTASRIENIAVSPDGKHLALLLPKEVAVLNLHSLRLVSYTTGGWELSPLCLCFHPEGELLAFGDARGGVHLWHDYGSLLKTFSHRRASRKGAHVPVMTVEQWLRSDDLRALHLRVDGTVEREEASKQGPGANKPKRAKQHQYLMRHMHWHSHMVRAIDFTTDGAYLITGGEEAVLVMTQLETGRHQFLPRLGGAIRHVSVSGDEVKFAVCLDSNVVRLIDSMNNRVVRTIEGLGCFHKLHPPPVLRHPVVRSARNPNCVVLPSLPGTVQFYDLAGDRSLGSLKLVNYPLVSRAQDKQPDRHTVECVALNHDGTRMVTVLKRSAMSILGSTDQNPTEDSKEGQVGAAARVDADADVTMVDRKERQSPKGRPADNKKKKRNLSPQTFTFTECEEKVDLVVMQIWHRQNDGKFVLNTRVESPHGTHNVKRVIFHPNKNRFLTFGDQDCNFRLWEEFHDSKTLKPRAVEDLSPTKFTQSKHRSWRSFLTGHYQQQAVTAAHFSADGTVLLVAVGALLTLWDGESLALLKTVGLRAAVTELTPLPDSFAVAARCGERLDIWDLSEMRQVWSLPPEQGEPEEPQRRKKKKKRRQERRVMDCVVVQAPGTTAHHQLLVTYEVRRGSSGAFPGAEIALCHVRERRTLQTWRLPRDTRLRRHSLVAQRMTDPRDGERDFGATFVTERAVVRLAFLGRQAREAQTEEVDPRAEDADVAMRDALLDAEERMHEYLEATEEGKSVFERIFGASGVPSLGVSDQELEARRREHERLLKGLRNDQARADDVVAELFGNASHAVPPLSRFYDQYLNYYLPATGDEVSANSDPRAALAQQGPVAGTTHVAASTTITRTRVLTSSSAVRDEKAEEEHREDVGAVWEETFANSLKSMVSGSNQTLASGQVGQRGNVTVSVRKSEKKGKRPSNGILRLPWAV